MLYGREWPTTHFFCVLPVFGFSYRYIMNADFYVLHITYVRLRNSRTPKKYVCHNRLHPPREVSWWLWCSLFREDLYQIPVEVRPAIRHSPIVDALNFKNKTNILQNIIYCSQIPTDPSNVILFSDILYRSDHFIVSSNDKEHGKESKDGSEQVQ